MLQIHREIFLLRVLFYILQCKLLFRSIEIIAYRKHSNPVLFFIVKNLASAATFLLSVSLAA